MVTAEATDVLDRSVTGRLAGRLAARAQAPTPIWLTQIASWRALVELCLELDDALNESDVETADALALHKAVLNLGIGTGEWLLHQIKTDHVDLSRTGERMENLEASLGHLKICFDSRHADVPQEEIERIRRRIFDVAS
jgi:hypothetical protein